MKLSLLFIALHCLIFPHGKDTTTTKVNSISLLGGKDVQITSHPFCEYADIAIDKNDDIFVVFTEYKDENERIVALHLRDTLIQKELVVSEEIGNEFNPRLTALNKGVAVVWAAKRNNRWDIFLRTITDDGLGKELKITNDENIDLNPTIVFDASGNVFIVWERIEKNIFQIAFCRVEGDRISAIQILSSAKELAQRPSLHFAKDKTLYLAWDEMTAGNYQIKFMKLKNNSWSKEEIISSHYGFNLSPSLAENKNGDIIFAWSSDVNVNGEIEFNNWIHYRIFSKGKFSSINTLAQHGDFKKLGEDQTLEFPTLYYDKNDRIICFTRSSQGFDCQFFNGKKLSELYTFDVHGWGGRGYNVRAAIDSKGNIFSVRRDLRAIFLHKMNPEKIDFNLSPHKVDLKSENIVYNSEKVEPEIILKGDYKIVYGDIHQHSALSDGRGTIDECYTRSKYRYKHDFAALSDHEWFTQNLIMPSEWEWIKIIGKYFDSPEFITFAGYEWTTPRVPIGFGHKNVYFNDWEHPIFSFKFDAKTSLDLFELLKKNNAITFPHHIGWTGIDWENHDENIQPNFELVSTHGAFEFMGNEPIMHRGLMPGYFIQDGLAKGLKFGFIGSSDGHGLRFHHGVGRKEDEWLTGLTGVLVKNFSKDEIFSSLKTRRVFATSGTKIQIKYSVSGTEMGKEITTSSPGEINFEVLGTNKIHKVILVKNNIDYMQWGKDIHDGKGARGKFIDEKMSEGTSYYYLRVIQEDGEMAWSSPVWINFIK